MKAIILAAGRSSRLYPLTLEKPKCLLKIGGKTILNKQIHAIRKIGIDDILVVVGYKGHLIKKELGNAVRYSEYNDFNKTNNFHTLWSVRHELNDSFICLFSDVLFDTDIIKRASNSTEGFCLMIDTGRVLEGTMRIKIEDQKITAIGSHVTVKEGDGNFIGIAKFSKNAAKLLLTQMQMMRHGHETDYYTIAIDALAKKGVNIGYIDVKTLNWIEIDTKTDLDKAKKVVGCGNRTLRE